MKSNESKSILKNLLRWYVFAFVNVSLACTLGVFSIICKLTYHTNLAKLLLMSSAILFSLAYLLWDMHDEYKHRQENKKQ